MQYLSCICPVKAYPDQAKAKAKDIGRLVCITTVQIYVTLLRDFAFAPMGREAINTSLTVFIFRVRFRSVWVDP